MKIIKLQRKFPPTKFGLILALFFICSQTLLSQTLDANRTTGTKIADLLNKFPAENSTALNSAMKEMSTFEPQELSQMILMLTENGDNEKLEFALSGFSFYVSQEAKDELSNKAVEAFGQTLDKIDFDEGKAFIIENL